MEKVDHGHIHLIIGASRLGAAIAGKHAHEGKYVTCIDKNPDTKFKLGDNFIGSFIKGDATKKRTLEDANIKSAKEIVIVTDQDDTNVYIANLCYLIFGKRNIIVRLTDHSKSLLLPSKDISVISPHDNSLLQYDLFLKTEEKRK